jgi:uncharacterized membrane protein
MNLKNKTFTLITCFFFISIIAFYNSCTNDPVLDVALMDTVCFQNNIFPLLQANCGKCHGSGGGTEGFSVIDYNSIMRSVTAGDPRHSALYNAITKINGENFMPPSYALNSDQRTLIQVWIAQGALNTSCDTSKTPTDTTTSAINYDSVAFQQDILPIFISKCSKCHDGTQGEENLNLTNYEGIMSAGVTPKDLNCKIYRVITETNPDDKMPPPNAIPTPAPVSSEEIALLKTWIEEGAINSDYPQKTCDTSGVITYNNTINSLIQTNCINCHNSSSTIKLDNYTHVKYYAELIFNGTPTLLGVTKQLNGFNKMPPASKLDDCTIYKIEKWINTGKVE